MKHTSNFIRHSDGYKVGFMNALGSALLEWRSSTLRGQSCICYSSGLCPTFHGLPFHKVHFLGKPAMEGWVLSNLEPLWLLLLPHLFDSNWRKFSAFKASLNQIGPTQIIQDNIPILKSVTLIISTKSLLLCNKTYQILGIWVWISLRDIILPTTALFFIFQIRFWTV